MGATVDSIADFIFVFIACVRIVPVLNVPRWLWLIVGVIAALQLARMCFLYFHKGGWDGLYDKSNRITGLALYLAPLVVHIADING